jgi:hypothetical protein
MFVGRNSVVGVATGNGVDGLGIEFQWGQGLSHSFRLALAPTQPLLQWVPPFFPRGKTAGLWRRLFTPI